MWAEIHVRPPWAEVAHNASRQIDSILTMALTVIDAEGVPHCYYHMDRRKLPLGLLSRAVHALESYQIRTMIHEVDTNMPTPNRGPFANEFVLRPDQAPAVDACEQFKRGVIWAGTAFGKTLVAAALARDYAQARVLVLTHRIDLFAQLVEELGELLGESVGQVRETTWIDARVMVATIQTLSARTRIGQHRLDLGSRGARLLQAANVLILDEAHTVASKTGYWLSQLSPAHVRIGLSGTPFKDEDVTQAFRLECATGPVLYYMPAPDLAELGVVADATVWMLPWCRDGDGVPNTADRYETGIVYHDRRNTMAAVMSSRAMAAKHQTLVVFQRRDHGPALQRALRALGWDLPCIDGTTPADERAAVWTGLKTHQIPGAITSLIVKEGLNLPDLRTIVLASGRKSNIEVLQVLGRGMRIKRDGGAQHVDLIDFWDVHAHGLRTAAEKRREIWCRAGHRVWMSAPEWALTSPAAAR